MGLVVIIGLVGVMFVSRVIGALIARDAAGWAPRVAERFVVRAAARLPEPHAERYTEEWLADMFELRDRPLTSLFVALQINLTIGVSPTGSPGTSAPVRRARPAGALDWLATGHRYNVIVTACSMLAVVGGFAVVVDMYRHGTAISFAVVGIVLLLSSIYIVRSLYCFWRSVLTKSVRG